MNSSTSALPTKKPVLKRTIIAPWDTAILGSKASTAASSPVTPSATTGGKRKTGASGNSPAPQQDIIPELLELQAARENPEHEKLSESARIKQLQREWELLRALEKQQLENQQSSRLPLGSQSFNQGTGSQRADMSGQTTATHSESPIPLPSYISSQKRPSLDATSGTPDPKRYQTDRGQAKADGNKPTQVFVPKLNQTVAVLTSIEGRPYTEYQAPDGTIQQSKGIIIPLNYKILDTPDVRFVCPVRTCRKRTDSVHALAGHIGTGHGKIAYNDNLDGTISEVGPYTNGNGNKTPAVIISQDKISPNASPPVEPTMSFANQLRTKSALRYYQKARRSELGVHVPAEPENDGNSNPVSYLHGFLAHRQQVPIREDINYMVRLPRRRELPDIWLQYHQSETLDTNHYACALAYIVGESVQGDTKCRQIEECAPRSTCRLSDQCIKLPAGIPFSARQIFSKTQTCVGCKYWSHLQRRPNPCNWNPERRLRKRGGSGSGEEASASSPAASFDPGSPYQAKSSYNEVRSQTTGLPKPAIDGPISGTGQEEGSMLKMEDWEFAPGKILDVSEKQTVAFSGSYLTSAQPITIADDISFNRLRIAPGGTQHWPAEMKKMRYCEIISGKIELRLDGQSLAIGSGGVFIIRPGMSCTAENRRYTEAVLSFNTTSNYPVIS